MARHRKFAIEHQSHYRKNAMDIENLWNYIAEDGSSPINDWLAGLDEAVREAIRADLVVMTETVCAHSTWPDELFKNLEDRIGSKCSGIEEILFEGRLDNGRKYVFRILGFRGPGTLDFTMLDAMNKLDDADYEQPCKTAQGRKNDVKGNWGKVRACDFAKAG